MNDNDASLPVGDQVCLRGRLSVPGTLQARCFAENQLRTSHLVIDYEDPQLV
jgi:hypothetical protein